MISLPFYKYEESTKIDIELCKRNYRRTKLGYLKCYNKKITKRFGNIDEIEFTIDKYYDKNGKIKTNPYYHLIEGKAILKVTILDEVKYFVIKDSDESKDDSKNIRKQVTAYSYEYTFNEKIIRAMKDVYKLYDIADPSKSILHEVIRLNPLWKIGYINNDVNKHRVMSVDEQSLLDFIYDLQKTFGCYIQFDTVDRTINVHKIEDIGRNKGLVLNERNYTNSLEIKPNYDDVVTRLWVYGKDDISINKFTTGGQSYVEMYDYYMNNPNMVDNDLVVAYNKYQELLTQKQGEFDALLTQLGTKFTEMSTLNNAMAKLKSDLKKIQDQIDVAINSMAEPDSPTSLDLTSLNNQEKAKQTEIDNKQKEVDAKQKEIDVVNTQIENLRKVIAGEANFTEEQLMSLNEITFEKVFRDTNIADEKELYEKALEELPKLAQPKISFEINLINFLKCIEHQINWDKVLFGLGDFVNIENEILPKTIAVRLIEFSFMEDGLDFDMKFSNKDSLDDPMVLFEELGKRVNSSSITLDINKFTYGKYEEERSELQDYINGQLDLSAQEAIAGKNQEVVINDRGITLTNRNDSNKQLKLLSSLIAFTEDGFRTVKSSIKNGYIVADYLIGKVILGNKLIIGDSEGTFDISGNKLKITDRTKKLRLTLGEYDTNKFGLKLYNKKGDVILDEDGILNTFNDSKSDNVASGYPLKMYVYIPSETISIKKCILRFKFDYFRGFSTTLNSGGYTSTSTDSISETNESTSTSLESVKTSGANNEVNEGNKHDHGIPKGTWLAVYNTYTEINGYKVLTRNDAKPYEVWIPSGAHTHSFTVPSHSHDFTIPSHSHKFTVESHTHNTTYGIYESTSKPRSVQVYVNNSLVGTYSSEQSNVNILPKLTIGRWNEITLSSTSDGRIDASIFGQMFVGT